MKTPAPIALSVSAVLIAATVAGCTSSKASSGKTDNPTKSSTSSTASHTSTSPSTDPTDYSSLLIGAADIPVPGVKEGTPAAPPQGTGVTVTFTATGGRTVGDTILIVPDAAAAVSAAQSAVNAAKQEITGAEVTTAPIGDGGTAIRGTSSGSAVAILIFTEGKALVVLQFESSASDPVPTDLIQQVATAQDTKIKSGLPH